MSCVIPIAISGQTASGTLGVRRRSIIFQDLSQSQTPFTVNRTDDGFFTLSDVLAIFDRSYIVYVFGLAIRDIREAFPVKFKSVGGSTYFYNMAGNQLGVLAIDNERYQPQRDDIVGIPNRGSINQGTQFIDLQVGDCPTSAPDLVSSLGEAISAVVGASGRLDPPPTLTNGIFAPFGNLAPTNGNLAQPFSTSSLAQFPTNGNLAQPFPTNGFSTQPFPTGSLAQFPTNGNLAQPFPTNGFSAQPFPTNGISTQPFPTNGIFGGDAFAPAVTTPGTIFAGDPGLAVNGFSPGLAVNGFSPGLAVNGFSPGIASLGGFGSQPRSRCCRVPWAFSRKTRL